MQCMVARFLAFGLLGWVVEALANGAPRYSRYVPAKLPFLPVYGAGGVLVTELATALRDEPLLARLGAYAVATTGVELAACWIDRVAGGHQWDYGSGLCVNGEHTAMWTALSLAVEPFV